MTKTEVIMAIVFIAGWILISVINKKEAEKLEKLKKEIGGET